MRSRTQLTQRIQNMGVLFSGIGLASDLVDFSLETGPGRDELVKLLDFVVVAVEQLEKGGLGASGALDAAESELAANALQVCQIREEILGPETSTFANSSNLGRLKVSKSKGRQFSMLHCEVT